MAWRTLGRVASGQLGYAQPGDLEVAAFEGARARPGGRGPHRSRHRSWTCRSALRAAAPSRARNSAESSRPEHEQVTSRPPGSTSFMARTFRSKYFRLPGSDFIAIGDQLGRVEDDHAERLAVLAHLARVAECVGVDHLEPDLVGVAVLARQGDGLLVEVDAGDLAGLAADQGVQAEAAGVRAEVEHRPAGAEPGDLAAVVALIAEEAGLVPLFEVNAVADSVLGAR